MAVLKSDIKCKNVRDRLLLLEHQDTTFSINCVIGSIRPQNLFGTIFCIPIMGNTNVFVGLKRENIGAIKVF